MIDRRPIGGRTVMRCKDGHGANALSGDSAADGCTSYSLLGLIKYRDVKGMCMA